ncbi:hypothetical protein E3P86_01665 [Wallemia ichthyophaga]|uniref:Ubiquitin-like domain-containing protein n=1 Tax=Wallemia ichthyophaga TaxID=245174 RepID=A0A4T0J889_WALIC|nr:hypothetical protein E3P86_01665 [Wallemia ichthyophaga]
MHVAADEKSINFISALYRRVQAKDITIPANAKPRLSDADKKPHLVDIPLADVPSGSGSGSSSNTPATLNLTVKNVKASQSAEISVQSSSTIADLKYKVVEAALAPSVGAQRLLLKGKALMDDKLVKDYDTLSSGGVLTLMLRGGAPSTPSSIAPSNAPSNASSNTPPPQNIPHVALTSADSDSARTAPDPAVDMHSTTKSDYEATLADSRLWKKLAAFLNAEFKSDEYGKRALETFFLSIKSTLSPSEIARIREEAGFEAM